MLTAVPKSWFSWNFLLREARGTVVGEVLLSSWRERGAVVADGLTYRIYRESLLGPFVMEAPDGSMAALASKPGAFRRRFIVSDDRRTYELKAVSSFGRKFDVFCDEKPIGAIEPQNCFGRQANIHFNEDVPPAIQAFLAWLTLLLWKRDSDAAAG